MCYDEGTLQAYLDRELNKEQEQAVEKHLLSCPRCRSTLESLEENSLFVAEHLSNYARALGQGKVDTGLAWQRFSAGHGTERVYKKQKGVLSMLGKYKKAVVAAAMVLALTVSFSFGSVRGFAADLLTIFRVEKVQAINISPEDMAQMEKAFREGSGNVDVDSLGKVEVTGKQQFRQATLDEVRQAVDFTVKLPATPVGYNGPNMGITSGFSVNLTLDTEKVNAMLQSMGSKELLPKSLNGRTFSLKSPAAVMAEYSSNDGTQKTLAIAQSRSPELKVPNGTDILALRSALLSIPALPDNLRRQLEAVTDWQHTALIPNIQGSSTEVMVNGVQGLFITQPDHANVNMSGLVWQQNGVIYMVGGEEITLEQAKAIASQMK